MREILKSLGLGNPKLFGLKRHDPHKEQFPELDSTKLTSYLTKRRRRDVGNGISAKLNLEVSTKTTSQNQAQTIKVSYFFIFSTTKK